MNHQPRAGFLPLYLKLYDERLPRMRREFEPFVQRIHQEIEQQGIDVIEAPICSIRSEISDAVHRFEQQGADCIVILHLTYSPSLEAIPILVSSHLPIVLCDTTMDLAFDASIDPVRLLYNHGIHGVQDLASILHRHKCPYVITAGHFETSDVISATADMVRAAQAVQQLRQTRALRLGPSFEGMGDFIVSKDVMKNHLGIHVDTLSLNALEPHLSNITDGDIAEEIAHDREVYRVVADDWAHQRATRIGLGLRQLLNEGEYDAFSMHFGCFDAANPYADVLPFAEASKAMSRGIGYAGEGDVLTAAFVGALNRSFGSTTFTEMFCPDWAGGSIFLSHMGEINPAIAARKPVLCDKPVPFCDSGDTVIIACCPRPGRGCLVNLAPQPDGRFALIVSPVEVICDEDAPAMRTYIRGWAVPSVPLPDFLKQYSDVGGTHHLALTLDARPEALCAVGRFMGADVYRIGCTEPDL